MTLQVATMKGTAEYLVPYAVDSGMFTNKEAAKLNSAVYFAGILNPLTETNDECVYSFFIYLAFCVVKYIKYAKHITIQLSFTNTSNCILMVYIHTIICFN